MQIFGIVSAVVLAIVLALFIRYIVRVYTNIIVERDGMKKLYRKPDAAASICNNEFHRMVRFERTLRFTETDEDCIAFEVLKADGTVEITFTFTGQPELIDPFRAMILQDLATDRFKGLRSDIRS